MITLLIGRRRFRKDKEAGGSSRLPPWKTQTATLVVIERI